MLTGDAIVFPQVTLGLIPKILNAIDVVVTIDTPLQVIDSIVFKFRYIEYFVRRQTIRIHNAIWMHLGVDDFLQGLRFRVGQNLRVDSSIALQDAKYGDLTRSTSATNATPVTSKIAFIHFDLTGKHIH